MKKTTVVFAFVLMLFALVGCEMKFDELEAPVASVSSGEYSTPQTVELHCSNRGAITIYYTLDGSDPMTSGTEYTGAITITYATCIPQTCLKAVAKNRRGDFSTVSEFKYVILGPAGGYVFYDCDADNDSGNADGLTSEDCHWQYLEATHDDYTKDSITTFVFGYYRTEASGSNLYVNDSTYVYVTGTSSATDGKSTGTAIGTGKANTTKLVSKMGSAAYTSSSGTDTTADYAAKVCEDCTFGGYDDWFLPSKDELNLMYTNLKSKGLGGFSSDHYWSSSEYSHAFYAWAQFFSFGTLNNYDRNLMGRVRAVRSFSNVD